jgi:hypothetical protein
LRSAERLEHVAVADIGDDTSIPRSPISLVEAEGLVITVTATRSTPRSSASTARIWSPSTAFPSASTASIRSPSPSKAIPRSCRPPSRRAAGAKVGGAAADVDVLPSGSDATGVTSAPSRSNAFGAIPE